jgi:hypothetical protein
MKFDARNKKVSSASRFVISLANFKHFGSFLNIFPQLYFGRLCFWQLWAKLQFDQGPIPLIKVRKF